MYLSNVLCYCLQIYFSVLLILPMFFWISWHEKDDDDNEEEGLLAYLDFLCVFVLS